MAQRLFVEGTLASRSVGIIAGPPPIFILSIGIRRVSYASRGRKSWPSPTYIPRSDHEPRLQDAGGRGEPAHVLGGTGPPGRDRMEGDLGGSPVRPMGIPLRRSRP